MKTTLAMVLVELADKCDKRTKALLHAIDALEEMHKILGKTRRSWTDKHRLMFSICDKTLAHISTYVEEDPPLNGHDSVEKEAKAI